MSEFRTHSSERKIEVSGVIHRSIASQCLFLRLQSIPFKFCLQPRADAGAILTIPAIQLRSDACFLRLLLRVQNCCVFIGFAQDLLNGQMLYVKLDPGFGAECFVSHETSAKVEPRVEARTDRRADGG